MNKNERTVFDSMRASRRRRREDRSENDGRGSFGVNAKRSQYGIFCLHPFLNSFATRSDWSDPKKSRVALPGENRI